MSVSSGLPSTSVVSSEEGQAVSALLRELEVSINTLSSRGYLEIGSDAEGTASGRSPDALEKELEKRNEVIAGLKDLVDRQRRCIAMLRAKNRHQRKVARESAGISAASASTEVKSGRCVLHSANGNADPKSNLKGGFRSNRGRSSSSETDASPATKFDQHGARAAELEGGFVFRLDEGSSSTSTITNFESDGIVYEIRKRALDTELMMASQQLDSVRSDKERISKELIERVREMEELKSELREKDKYLSTVELERDLLAADAARLREEVKSLEAREDHAQQEIYDLTSDSNSDGGLFGENQTNFAQGSQLCLECICLKQTIKRQEEAIASLQGSIDKTTSLYPQKECQEQNYEKIAIKTSLDKSWPLFDMSEDYTFSGYRSPFQSNATESSVTNDDDGNRDDSSSSDPQTEDFSEGRGLRSGQKTCEHTERMDESAPLLHQVEASDERNTYPNEWENIHFARKTKPLFGFLSHSRKSKTYYDTIINSLQRDIAELKHGKIHKEVELINQLAVLDHERQSLIKKLQKQIAQQDQKIANLEKNVMAMIVKDGGDKIQIGIIEEYSEDLYSVHSGITMSNSLEQLGQ